MSELWWGGLLRGKAGHQSLGPFPLDPRQCWESALGQKLFMYCLGERFTHTEPRVQNAESIASTLHCSLPPPTALASQSNQRPLTPLNRWTLHTQSFYQIHKAISSRAELQHPHDITCSTNRAPLNGHLDCFSVLAFTGLQSLIQTIENLLEFRIHLELEKQLSVQSIYQKTSQQDLRQHPIIKHVNTSVQICMISGINRL